MRVPCLVLMVAALSACPPPEEMPPRRDAGVTVPVEKGACEGPRPTPLRLLTRVEFNNSVRDILGETSNPANALPREPVALNFENNADVLLVSSDAVSRYLDVAETIATSTVRDRRARLVNCGTVDGTTVPTPNSQEAAAAQQCGLQFIQSVGRRLYRRPLESDEVSSLVRLFNNTLARSGFNTSLEWTLAAMLQSPQFLYRAELGAPIDPLKASIPLTNWDLASKLSYLVWATAPDDELLNAAGNGALMTDDGLRQQATRMLADARAVDGLSYALNQLLRTNEVGGLEKTAAVYPTWTPEVAAAAQTSLAMFVSEVLRTDGTYKGLLTSPKLFVNNTLSMYAPATTTDFVEVTMPAAERIGLLTQPGLLARLAGPDQSSPIRRGVFVLDKVMCQPPPPPTPGLAIVPPALDPTLTTRERFDIHSKSDACNGCHQVIDPVGFGFEHFDGMGVRRSQDNGKPVDATGKIVGANDSSLMGAFSTEAELVTRLSNSRQVHDCMASNLMRYALGRADKSEDACSLKAAQDKFFETSRFKDLELAIIMSSSFRTRALPETP